MLNIQGLRKEYPGFTLDCSMQVLPGRITGLIGQNGAGKTTLFKAVLQLIRPDAGQITLLGKNISEITEEDKQRMGAVLADSGFSGYITVGDARKLLKQFYPLFDEAMFRKQCARFGLDDKKKLKELSTGMKAKLKILSALSHQAKLLILDEPTAGLDVLAREDVLALLREYMEEDDSRAILISSHISSDLETLCDDFYMIHDGKIVLHEDTDRLLGEYAILKVDKEAYAGLDKTYLIKMKEEPYGYSCLTDQREFYRENYPELVIEKSGLDELILLMIRGETI
ncbi:MAG: ABC transporter ATP-binding protein [Blautia sp.]|nr:ABC transporter ATP-binding protein [Blautia sp.]